MSDTPVAAYKPTQVRPSIVVCSSGCSSGSAQGPDVRNSAAGGHKRHSSLLPSSSSRRVCFNRTSAVDGRDDTACESNEISMSPSWDELPTVFLEGFAIVSRDGRYDPEHMSDLAGCRARRHSNKRSVIMKASSAKQNVVDFRGKWIRLRRTALS